MRQRTWKAVSARHEFGTSCVGATLKPLSTCTTKSEGKKRNPAWRMPSLMATFPGGGWDILSSGPGSVTLQASGRWYRATNLSKSSEASSD